MRRLLLAASTGLLAVLLLAPPAAAEEQQGNDPANDVPFDRGDIIFYRAIHTSSTVDLRVRTALGGHPVNTWPNRVTRIRWRIETESATPGPEFFADIQIARGVDTVLVGRVRYADTNVLVPNCQAQEHVPGDNLVSASGNRYRFRFLRGCIGAPDEFRARATFIWDNARPNVGPVYTDFAPQGGPTQPLGTF
jgi:hypothetical protein